VRWTRRQWWLSVVIAIVLACAGIALGLELTSGPSAILQAAGDGFASRGGPGPEGCFSGSSRLVATPSHVRAGEVVTLELSTSERLSPAEQSTIETGNYGNFDGLSGGSWYWLDVAATWPVGSKEALKDFSATSDVVIAGVGLADVPLRARVPDVGSGTYRFRLQYSVLPTGVATPLKVGNYQFCAQVTVH
jgi:hypothetical protein